MRLELAGPETTTEVDLHDGTFTLGGSPRDSISLEGLPSAFLSLSINDQTLQVMAQRTVYIGEALFPARVPRLLVEGDALRLPNDWLLRRPADPKKRESRKQMGTAFVARELLSDAPIDVPPTRAATLTCVTGYDRGRVLPIAFDENIIGRADDVPLRVRDRAVSRQHARIVRDGKQWTIEPLSSAMNGAWLNGSLIKRRTLLRTGDTIELGQTVLRFDEAERAPEEQSVCQPTPNVVEVPAVAELRHELDKAPVPAVRRLVPPTELLLMALGAALSALGMGTVLLVLR